LFEIDKPEVSLRHEQSIVSNLNLLVIENDHLTLNCQIESNPPYEKPITWLKNGASIPGLLSLYENLTFFLCLNFQR
jgi:hypothetical protein